MRHLRNGKVTVYARFAHIHAADVWIMFGIVVLPAFGLPGYIVSIDDPKRERR